MDISWTRVMDSFLIEGDQRLAAKVQIDGSRLAAVPMMTAA